MVGGDASANGWRSNGWVAVAALALGLAAGCSAGTDPAATTSSASGQGGAGQSGAGAADGSGGGLVTSAVTAGGGGEGGQGCDSYSQQGERKPLHLFVLLDRSSSMAGDKWDDAVNGLAAFVADDDSVGIDFALRTLPRPGTPTCDAHEYATPEVGWGDLPGLAPDVETFLGAALPDGAASPFYPALGGALLATIERADANPGDAAAVLVLTDGAPAGEPSVCGGADAHDVATIAQLAANALANDNPVYTFVVGLRNVDLAFANAVAAAGGTEEAFPIAGNNPAAALGAALDTIRAKALSCTYEIPADVLEGAITISEVNVELTVGGGTTTIPRNDGCDGPGWTYDDPSDPTQIILCPESCEALRSDPESRLDVVLGCQTIVN